MSGRSYSKIPFSLFFIFTNKRFDAIKLLVWDINGYGLYHKVIESREKFHWPRLFQEEVVEMTSEQLCWLMDGYDVWSAQCSTLEAIGCHRLTQSHTHFLGSSGSQVHYQGCGNEVLCGIEGLFTRILTPG